MKLHDVTLGKTTHYVANFTLMGNYKFLSNMFWFSLSHVVFVATTSSILYMAKVITLFSHNHKTGGFCQFRANILTIWIFSMNIDLWLVQGYQINAIDDYSNYYSPIMNLLYNPIERCFISLTCNTYNLLFSEHDSYL